MRAPAIYVRRELRPQGPARTYYTSWIFRTTRHDRLRCIGDDSNTRQWRQWQGRSRVSVSPTGRRMAYHVMLSADSCSKLLGCRSGIPHASSRNPPSPSKKMKERARAPKGAASPMRSATGNRGQDRHSSPRSAPDRRAGGPLISGMGGKFLQRCSSSHQTLTRGNGGGPPTILIFAISLLIRHAGFNPVQAAVRNKVRAQGRFMLARIRRFRAPRLFMCSRGPDTTFVKTPALEKAG